MLRNIARLASEIAGCTRDSTGVSDPKNTKLAGDNVARSEI